jgi:hypothetical protein
LKSVDLKERFDLELSRCQQAWLSLISNNPNSTFKELRRKEYATKFFIYNKSKTLKTIKVVT